MLSFFEKADKSIMEVYLKNGKINFFFVKNFKFFIMIIKKKCLLIKKRKYFLK